MSRQVSLNPSQQQAILRGSTGLNPTSSSEASSLQSERDVLATGRHQGPDLHTVVQLRDNGHGSVTEQALGAVIQD